MTIIRTAASSFGVAKSTLQDRVSKYRNNCGKEEEFDDNKSSLATRQFFSTIEERDLELYIKKSSKIFFGLTYKNTLAYEYAVELHKKYPENWD